MTVEDIGFGHAEAEALRDSVRRLLADRCAEANVRRIMDRDDGHDPALWQALTGLGLAGLTIPTALELAMEEAGAALLPAPLMSCAMAAALLADDPLADAIADGSSIATVAFAGMHDWTGRGDVTIGDRITGTARFVTDAAIADMVLLAADEGVFAIDRNDARITPLPVFDRTRRMADVTFDAPARQVAGPERIARAVDLGVVALAGEQAGAARAMLDRTVAYARDRHQFGRAIGSFQAIKHMAADLLLEVESASSAARDAARQLDAGTPGKDAAVALAAFACADAVVRVAADGIQMHGGIAFTWDHPAHLYLRRARSGAQLFGDGDLWRDRYLSALEAAA